VSAVTRVAIRRPVLVSMAFGAVVLLGIVAATRLPVTELPKVNFPAVTITTSDPGSNSQTVEQYVTTPVEQSLQGITGVSEIDGTSVAGTSRVVVQLNSGVDVTNAANQISQAVGSLGRHLPTGATTPSIRETNPYATPLLTVNFAGQDSQQLYESVTSIAAPRLQLVKGVGEITLNGGVETNAQVSLDPALLQARNVTVTQVDQALSTGSNQVPAGTITIGSLGTSVTSEPTAANLSQLAQVVVGTDGGAPVTLGEVANITQAPASQQTTSELDGRPNVSLTITAQDGANAIATDDAIKAELNTLRRELPAGVESAITSDTTTFTRAALGATAEDLILAIILASLVILLFLQSLRETVIVLVAIPTSLATTLLAMYAFGFSLDVISLLAFSLLIGILVDDAIVVVENIGRHLAAGQRPADAAYRGRTEIGAAAVALTLTDVVVFLPVVFAGGVTGQILLEFGVTITVASLISLAVSFTLTPMLAARWLKAAESPISNGHRPCRWRRLAAVGQRVVGRLTDGYEQLLRATLRVRPAVLVVAAAAAATSILLVVTARLPSAYVPAEDTGLINVATRLPPGTTLKATDTDIQRLATLIRAHVDGVTTVATTASALGGGSLTVDLVPKTERSESATVAAQAISRLALTIPGMRANATVPNPLIPPNGNGLQIVIRGNNPATVADLSNTASGSLDHLPQLGQTLDTANEATASYNIQVNQTAAAHFGVSQAAIADTLATAIGGTQEGSIESSQGIEEPIQVQFDNPNLTLDQLLNLPVATTASASRTGVAQTGAGAAGAGAGAGAGDGGVGTGGSASTAPVTLSQVATITNGTAPLTITDYDGLPQATIRASIATGFTTAAAVDAVKHNMAGIHFPAGYDYLITGANQQQATAFAPLETALALSPLLVYMLLAGLYESLVLPFCVLLAVPLATAGAFCTLVWAGQTINLFSLIGLLMLIGLVSKNAILLVDRAESLRRAGHPTAEAIVNAARIRLRPILMTTLTVVIAMLPIALIPSAGSEDRTPMALVLVGGLTSSTLLTLVVVPTLYTYLDALRRKVQPNASKVTVAMASGEQLRARGLEHLDRGAP
jgi:hydrophobic/amphiphilic exporter-1 (mainly G- bacteria), HAE1 family